MELEQMVIAPYAVGTLYPKGCRRLRCWTMPNAC